MRVIIYAYDGLQRLADAMENLGTIYYDAYDAAGNCTDVVPNGGYAFTLRGAFAADDMIVGCTFALGADATGLGGPSPLSSARVITYAYHRLQRLTDAVENLGTTDHFAYDAAGNRTDVVLNGVLDTHHDCDAANQVLG
jgi:YD repeat-containing protein